MLGCGGDSNNTFAGNPGTNNPNNQIVQNSNLISVTPKETVTAQQLRTANVRSIETLGARLDRADGVGNDANEGSIIDDIWNLIKLELGRYIVYDTKSAKVTYISHDFSGKAQTVTGLLVTPVGANGKNVAAPMLSLQHPTLTLRQYSPSAQSLSLSNNELQYQIALFLASAGYIVVAADYPGLGDNRDPHPYSHPSLANSVLDLIDVSKTALPNDVTWNGQLYLMGFSEGGYATVVSARALQERGTPPNAAAGLDGPYSLSQTMRNIIINSGTSFPAAYFVPLMVAGYSPIYSTTVPVLAITAAFIPNPPGYTPVSGSYAQDLVNLTNGDHSSEEIDALARQAVPYTGPASVLSSAFRTDLSNTASQLVQTLVINDAYYNWQPTFPLRLIHNNDDDLVPVQNATLAAAAFAGQSNVTSELYTFNSTALGSVHATSLPVATVLGFRYIDSFAFPNR